MAFDPNKPYNDLPILPPQHDIESAAILKKTISASRSLAELKQMGAHIPNQAVLVNTIPMLEAQVSTEIENIFTTMEELFRFATNRDGPANAQTKEAFRYHEALSNGYKTIRKTPIGVWIALEICGTIRNTDIDIRKTQVAIANAQTNTVIYTPPDGQEQINQLLRNWEHFGNEATTIDPLIRMAVMHYQFEAIHPFTDGNGRTGRILNILFLVQEGLLDIPVLYLSRYFLQQRSDYYRLLRCVTEEHAWEAWILYMLDAVEQTAKWTAQRIGAIRLLHENTREYVQSKLPKIYTKDLIDLLFAGPYVRIESLTERGLAQRETASKYLRQFSGIGILREIKAGRSKYFLNEKFWHLLLSEEPTFEPYQLS